MQSSIESAPAMALNPQNDIIRALSERLTSVFEEFEPPPPSILYHYTSAEGLLGILRRKELWMTDLRYMNDASELTYATKLLTVQLTRRQTEKGLTQAERQFIDSSLARLSHFISLGENVPFSVSFCEEGDALSQWRAYRGRSSGYALGFDFFHLLRFLARPCRLQKIIYDSDRQVAIIEAVISIFLSAIAERARAMPDDSFETALRSAANAFISWTVEYVTCLKDPSFQEEREWRLVHVANLNPRLGGLVDQPSFRPFGGNVIPYVTLSLEEAIRVSRDNTMGVAFPLVRVNIGPTANAEINQESVKMLLLSVNPDVIHDIRQSRIPIRWL